MIAFLMAFAVAAQAPQDTSRAYNDARAAQLVQQARARRQFVDRSIRNYQAVAKERISIGLRTRLRDRLFYRRETASHIDWRRGGPINITVLGAREAVPMATSKVSIPGDLTEFLPRLAFDPLDMDELLRIDTTSLRHPLSDGAEAQYTYRTGESTTISLGQTSIKLVELQAIPRRRDYHLISGSFWICHATHSVVEVVFRMAKDFNLIEDADEDDREEMKSVPGFLRPIRAELQYVTIEYGLIHLRWWMPRLFAAEGIFQMGPIKTPMNYERSYSDYQVGGDTAVALIARTERGDSLKRCRPSGGMQINVSAGNDNPSPEELERRRERAERARARRDSILAKELAEDTARARRRREAEECSKLYHIIIEDSTKLLTSSELPPSIYGDNEELTSDPELAKLAKQLERLASAPWQFASSSFTWGPYGNGLLRYNKVEGLSVGARYEFEFGQLKADGTARVGVADWEPGLELGITRSTPRSWLRGAAYRRLDVMDAAAGFGGVSAQLGALLFARDERDYFRATGGELVIRPAE